MTPVTWTVSIVSPFLAVKRDAFQWQSQACSILKCQNEGESRHSKTIYIKKCLQAWNFVLLEFILRLKHSSDTRKKFLHILFTKTDRKPPHIKLYTQSHKQRLTPWWTLGFSAVSSALSISTMPGFQFKIRKAQIKPIRIKCMWMHQSGAV